ncbi:hypothetical protein [Rossellomorea sp. NS-SX7]|uniref:hypothetical protein n=1 Tax=Rossellomorea sp. NS-SX7 TaxID=3463856 RepID=UPI00405989FD
MELRLTKDINKRFWYLFPWVLSLVSLANYFTGWEFQYFVFNELEDYGELLFVLLVLACESALITVFILWMIHKVMSKYGIKGKMH